MGPDPGLAHDSEHALIHAEEVGRGGPPNPKNRFCNLFVCRRLEKWGLTPIL